MNESGRWARDASVHSFSHSLRTLTNFLDREGNLRVAMVRRVWPEVVEGPLAAHSWPTRIEESVIWVACDSAPVRAAATLNTQKILDRLRDMGYSFGEVRFEIKRRRGVAEEIRG